MMDRWSYGDRQSGEAVPLGEETLNAETLKAIEDAEKGIGLSRGFTSVEELLEDLNADD